MGSKRQDARQSNDEDEDVPSTSSPKSPTSEATSEASHPSSPTDDVKDSSSNLDDEMPSRWFQSLAIFGDSTVALGLSLGLLLLSVGMAWYLEHTTTGTNTVSQSSPSENINAKQAAAEEEAYRKLGPLPDWIETSVPVVEWKDDAALVQELKASFDRDGVIAVRGLLEPDLLQRLDEASAEIIQQQYDKRKAKPKGALTGNKSKKQQSPTGSGTQFFTVKEGAIFLGLNSTHNGGDLQTSTNSQHESSSSEAVSIPPFLEVALQSKIPEFISKVLLELPSHETLRLMRDIFLAKDTDEYICGWHVDDTGFWPATAEAPGVNAWIALDDMPVEGGGGFALAVGSHSADWRHEAYRVSGSTHTFPPEGFTSAKDIVDRRVGNGTCNVATAAPHLHRRMEESKRIYNMKRGDVIFHTRWLFHRTVPFERSVVEEQTENEPPLLYRRYSARFGPGSSEIPKGYGTEPSVLWNVQNAGRTADQVAAEDAPWYPQAWPAALDSELQQLEAIATEKLVKVTRQADARRQQMRKTRRLAARQQVTHEPH